MLHRYGRHGPRAWLRMRERRYRPSVFPAVVPPVQPEASVIQIRIPVGISLERIIFIIMGQEYSDKRDMQVVGERGGGPYTPIPISVTTTEVTTDGNAVVFSGERGDHQTTKEAERQVSDDVETIAVLSQKGKLISIDQQEAERRIVVLANRYIRKTFTELSPRDREWGRYATIYFNSYFDYFPEAEAERSAKTRLLAVPQEVKLHTLATHDRKSAPTYSDRNYHIRDIAMVRALQVLDLLPQAAIDHLPELHILADVYQDYYSNPREMEVWPVPGSF